MSHDTPENRSALDILRGISIILHTYPGHSFWGAFKHASWCEGMTRMDDRRAVQLLKMAKEELATKGSPIRIDTGDGMTRAIRHLVPPRPQQVLKDDPFRL